MKRKGQEKKMKVCYIAGPFTGKTAWDVEQNVRRAEEAALAVAKMGLVPLCPQANGRFFLGQRTAKFWYEATLELMRRCDIVLFIAGWEGSKGCVAEQKEARRLGLPYYFTLEGLSLWLKEQ